MFLVENLSETVSEAATASYPANDSTPLICSLVYFHPAFVADMTDILTDIRASSETARFAWK